MRTLSPGYRCPAFLRQGWPDNWSEPRCGFTEDGKFKPDNWACATLIELRQQASAHGYDSRTEDHTLYMTPFWWGWVLLHSYKHRGCTDKAWAVKIGEEPRALCLQDLGIHHPADDWGEP